MKTECKTKKHKFQPLGNRNVEADFNGGVITSDAGATILREVEKKFKVMAKFAECFVDHRKPWLVEHTVRDLAVQRILGIALGYEDLNDHDELRNDHLLGALVGKTDPTGMDRYKERDKGKPLAGKSTLNRMELSPDPEKATDKYKKITIDEKSAENYFIDLFIQTQKKNPEFIILDFDATDDPLHGNQEGRFFNGHYDNYCYLPLYVFSGEDLLSAKLQTAKKEVAAGTIPELEKIVSRIREAWPDVKILVRGDAGFCRDYIMNWCESHGVDFVFGCQSNERLEKIIAGELTEAKKLYKETEKAARVFKEFQYKTRTSWSRKRRVIAKAEHLPKGPNPRFIVTSLPKDDYPPRSTYEEVYCARGDMENRIKEQQLWLYADRTSSMTMRANQLRLWFSSVAYMLFVLLRKFGLAGTKAAKAQCGTIRDKLLKIGAIIKVSVRRVFISMSEAYPHKELFAAVIKNLNMTSIPQME